MKRVIVCLVLLLMSFSASGFAADSEHEQERVKDAGEVLKEILNIPDDIPQDLLDKAECVVVLPSVKKGAFGIGGSYGRGVMVCREWAALYRQVGSSCAVCAGGCQHRISVGRPGYGFCAPRHESQGSDIFALQQGQAWS